MRRRVLLAALLLALALVSVAFARDPRREQVRLNPADVALAKRITLRLTDLPAGTTKRPVPASDGQTFKCAEVNPDFSAFTITGKAKSAFAAAQTTQVISSVEVYKSRSDAAGDFKLGAKPALAKCLGREMANAMATGGVPTRIASARVVPAPRVGERRIAFRVVATATSPAGAKTNIYADVVVVQRGRSIAVLTFMSVFNPYPRGAQAVKAVAARMR